MKDLPANGDGLAWIAARGIDTLLLRPGVKAGCITAAAQGDQQALMHLQQAARQPGTSRQDDAAQELLFYRSHALLPPSPSHLMVLHRAAHDGELAALRWLLALSKPMVKAQRGLMGSAAANGQLHVMQYLLARPDPVTVCDTDLFAAQAHPHCLLWLLERCPSLPSQQVSTDRLKRFATLDDLAFTLEMLVATNNWRSIRLLHARGKLDLSHWVLADREFTAAAAKTGHLEALQWLRSLRPPCPWDESVWPALAARGDLAMLQWLHAQADLFPWCPREVMHQAVLRGNVAMMEWLHSIGCSFDGSHYVVACVMNQAGALEWLHEKKVALPQDVEDDYVSKQMTPAWLMFLADIGWPINALPQDRLLQAREAFCTFHGLVRWARHSADDAGQRRSALSGRRPHAPGLHLLMRLSRLPQELLNMIAGQADIQHNIST